jgi:DNA repair protein RecO (recombination protein O)
VEEKTEGLVLRSIDYKENDKLLTIFTPTNGKITAGIRGVRKGKAKLHFAAQPFAFCEYILAERGGRYTVTNAYLHDGFFSLRNDIVRYYAGCSVLEVCEKLLVEDGDNHTFFIAAIEALKSISEGDAIEGLITFCLVALREAGYMIDVGYCGGCGEEVGATPYFDFTSGQFFCGNCAQGVRASESTYALLQKCAHLRYDEKACEGGEKRALRLIKEYLKEKIEGEFPCFGELIRLL